MSFLQSPIQPTFNSGRLDVLESYYIIDTVNDTVTIGKPTTTVIYAGNQTIQGNLIRFQNTDNNIGISTTEIYNHLTTGSDNIAIGYECLNGITEGIANTAIGFYAGKSITTGIRNVAIGRYALQHINSGDSNVAIGEGSGWGLNTSGNNNVCIGLNSGRAPSLAAYANCTFLGAETQLNITSPYTNSTAIGYGATISASNQVSIGTASETIQCPGGVTITGHTNASTISTTGLITGASLTLTTSAQLVVPDASPYNIGMGHSTMFASITSGQNNTAMGAFTMRNVTSGSYNVAIGNHALDSLTTGNTNTGIGRNTLPKITTGSHNTAIGYFAGERFNLGSSGNTAIGTESGTSATDYAHTNCTFLGYKSSSNGGPYSNSTAIGYQAVVDADNQIMMGNTITRQDIQATGNYRGRYDGFDYSAAFTGRAPIGTLITHNSGAIAIGTSATNIDYTGFDLLDAGVWMMTGYITINKGTGTYATGGRLVVNWNATQTNGVIASGSNSLYTIDNTIDSTLTLAMCPVTFVATSDGSSRPNARYKFTYTTAGSMTVTWRINATKIA